MGTKSEWPEYEHALLAGIDDLMGRWKASLPEASRECFVADGPYPNYTRQRRRILFIAREAYGGGGWDYLEGFLPRYQGKEPLQERGGWFHHRLLWVAWGILKRRETWGDIPGLQALFPHFGKPEAEGGFSFAFMNANKLSDKDNWQTDWGSFGHFVETSAAFLLEEVALLHPDVIISMNMRWHEAYQKALGIRTIEHVLGNNDVALYRLPDGTPLLDTWHFSAFNKSPDGNIYAPIVQALQLPEINLW